MSNITPIKLGIKFNPSSLILIYNDKSKLRSRTIPVKELDILTDLRLFTEKFKKNASNSKYFEKIPANKLEKQFFILQDNLKGYNLTESIERAAKKYDYLNNGSKSRLDETTTTESTTSREDEEKGEEDNKNTVNLNLFGKNKTTSNKNDSDFDNDFKDTDDEEEEEEKPSVSTIEDVKAKKENEVKGGIFEKGLMFKLEENKPLTNISKSSALDLLTTQLKAVKSNIYDFEDDVEDEVENQSQDSDDDDDKNILNFGKKTAKKEEEKIEVPKHDSDSSDSF